MQHLLVSLAAVAITAKFYAMKLDVMCSSYKMMYMIESIGVGLCVVFVIYSYVIYIMLYTYTSYICSVTCIYIYFSYLT